MIQLDQNIKPYVMSKWALNQALNNKSYVLNRQIDTGTGA